jgi:hypothetical protein
LIFWDRVSLCHPGWPQTLHPPVSTSQVLGLQACATTHGWDFFLNNFVDVIYIHQFIYCCVIYIPQNLPTIRYNSLIFSKLQSRTVIFIAQSNGDTFESTER